MNSGARLLTAFVFLSNAAWGQAPAAIPVAKPPQPPPAVGAIAGNSLESFTGVVTIQTKGSPSAQPVASAPALLQTGDKVIVGPDSTAVLRLSDSSEVRLSAGSEFMVAAQKTGLMALFLWSGKLWADVVSDRSRRFEVRTAGAVAAVRGTRFSVETSDGKNTAVEVFEGAVAVDGLKGYKPLGGATLVLPGQRVDVSKGSAPGAIRNLIMPQKRDASKAPSKAQLNAQLQTALAKAASAKHADVEVAVKAALASGDEHRMNQVASALRGSSDLSEQQREGVAKAFSGGRSLSQVEVAAAPAKAAAAPGVKPPQRKLALKMRIGREIGLQNDQHSRHAAQTQASASTSAMGARAANMAGEQQYTEAYFDAQNAPAAANASPTSPTTTASGSGGSVSSVQTTLLYSAATSPTYSSPTGVSAPPPVYTPPPVGGTVNCSGFPIVTCQ